MTTWGRGTTKSLQNCDLETDVLGTMGRGYFLDASVQRIDKALRDFIGR